MGLRVFPYLLLLLIFLLEILVFGFPIKKKFRLLLNLFVKVFDLLFKFLLKLFA